jgi:dihydroflavonol-4-reductase
MTEAGKDRRVLVTGGSGYVAGWMIVGLLRRGFRVRATLRSLAKEAAVRADLAAQVDPRDRLSFCVADLTRDDGWDDAVRDCHFVLHVASPMGQGLPRNTDLLGPARDGSLRVLKAAAGAQVERVVVTSSLVAALPAAASVGATDETVWTDLAAKGVDNYTRSKTLAERAVWEFVERATSGLTVATILPGMIQGPVLAGSVAGSVEIISRLLNGKVPAIPQIGFAIVDVRDLVDLHVEAMLAPAAANQRFVAANEFLWLSDIARLLRERLGARAAKVPTRAMPNLLVRLAALVQEDARFIAPKLGVKQEFSHAKAATLLDWQPRSARESIVDTAESLIARGLA